MIRQVRALLMSLFAVLMLGCGVRAAEYDGYIIRIDPRVAFLSERQELPEEVEEICGEQHLYRTADEALVAELETAGLLVYAEPDYPVYLLELPDDPALTDGRQWDLDMIGMEWVWEQNVSGVQPDGTAVRIGVIDSGVYAEHEDLAGANLVPGINLLAEEGTAERYDTSDSVGHGTFIAGTIAAVTNNGLGIAGIAPEAEIMPLKSFDSTRGNVSDILEAIYAGVEAGCRVLNMSFGLEKQYAGQALAEAVAYAAESGVILVAAVGNDSFDDAGEDPLLYPAAYEEVIGVGSAGSQKESSSFSYRNSSVGIVAPGEKLYGLSHKKEDAYRTGTGTSFAAAEVTAAAALALSVDPELKPVEFGALLRESAEDLGEAGYDTVYGHGLLNLSGLLELLRSGAYMLQSATGEAVVIRAGGMEPGSKLQAVCAAYDENGAQVFLMATILTAGEDGALRGQVPLPEEGHRVNLMLLDDGWRPAGNCWTTGIAERVPAEDPPTEGDESEV